MAAMSALRWWSTRKWLTAAAATVVTVLALGLPTDVIPNPVFGRQGTPVTWWSYPVLAITAALSGLLFATYVRNDAPARPDRLVADARRADRVESVDRPGRMGSFGGALSFFAIGCPICNKVVVIALGAAGAVRWFAPVQPYLGIVSMALVGWALRARLRGELACPVPPDRTALAVPTTERVEA